MSYTGSVHIDGIKPVSFILAGSSALSPYRAVKLHATLVNNVQITANDTGFIGITQDVSPVSIGDHIAVKTSGFTLATVGADPIAVGDFVTVATDGTIITATTTAIGQAINSGATGEYVEIRLFGSVVTL